MNFYNKFWFWVVVVPMITATTIGLIKPELADTLTVNILYWLAFGGSLVCCIKYMAELKA